MKLPTYYLVDGHKVRLRDYFASLQPHPDVSVKLFYRRLTSPEGPWPPDAAAQTPPCHDTGRWLAAALLDEVLGIRSDRGQRQDYARHIPRGRTQMRRQINAMFQE